MDGGGGGAVSTRRGAHAAAAITAAAARQTTNRIGANANIRDMIRKTSIAFGLLSALLLASHTSAQTAVTPYPPARLTADDYARAEQRMGYNTDPPVLDVMLSSSWIDDTTLRYRVRTAEGERTFTFNVVTGHAIDTQADESRPRAEVVSPDGRRAVFIRDFNLWMRDIASGSERPLTTDGV